MHRKLVHRWLIQYSLIMFEIQSAVVNAPDIGSQTSKAVFIYSESLILIFDLIPRVLN